MEMKTVETGYKLLRKLWFMKLDLDVEVEEEDMFINGMFAEPEKFAQDMFLQRQLNSSGHAAPERLRLEPTAAAHGREGGR